MKILSPFSPESFHVCRAPEGTGSGGGGEGGGELDAKMTDLILRTVNAAVTSQLGRKLPEKISDAVSAAMAPIQESITKLVAPGGPGAGAGTGEGDKGPKGGQNADNPQIANLIKQQEAMARDLKAEREGRADDARKLQDQRRNQLLQNGLTTAGVEPLRMRGALAEVLPMVHTGEDGQVFLRSNAKGYDEDLALEDGLKVWAGTDVGKSYLAPKPGGGSGSTTPGARGGPRPGNAPLDPKTAKAQRVQAAREDFRKGVASLVSQGATIQISGGQGDAGE